MSNRILPMAVKVACERQGIECASFSDDWVLRLNKDDKVTWVIGDTFDCNRAAAAAVATDKVATSLVLRSQNIPVVEHVLMRSKVSEPVRQQNLSSNFSDNEPVVIKPLTGNGARGVRLMKNYGHAADYIHNSVEPAWAISPYLELEAEYRLIILENRVLLAYEKTHPSARGGPKYFNLKYGAIPRIADLKELGEITDLALRAHQAIGLAVAAVDVCVDESGTARVIEINQGITLQHFAQHSSEYNDRAMAVYDQIIAIIFN